MQKLRGDKPRRHRLWGGMSFLLSSLRQSAQLPFDSIIDVRSPAEHLDDHMPGALNLPVMSNEERAQVGTIYKQVSPFDARKIGAAILAKNAARHIEGPLAHHKGGWQPLIYCWRGGQRSNAFALILRQIGWRAQVVEGGYKSFRTLVVDQLYTQPFPAPVVILDGNTGTAKTEILGHLAAMGVQTLDLEGLANHRGSIFGAMGAQPAQRLFESRLALKVAQLDPTRPVVIEAESTRIGALRLPPSLWAAMSHAPRIQIEASTPERARYLVRAYDTLTADPAHLLAILDQLVPFHGRERIEVWRALVAQGDLTTLAQELIERHYDPRYRKHRARAEVPVVPLVLPSLTPEALPAAAHSLLACLSRLPLSTGASHEPNR